MQAVATFLFFIVFIQLFIALSLYLGITIYTYFKKARDEKSIQDKTDQSEKHV